MLCAIVFAVLLGADSAANAQLLNGPTADAYPIIAQLYGDPDQYAGHTVMIYGLVVGKQPPSTFELQDVSDHPLKIVGNAKIKVEIGDQLIVVGVFHNASTGPFVAATSLIRAKVLGGGGCC
ncbi:MAG: hypothetical protein WBF58_19340 [Xanthobacteraceae bacterium]